MDLGVNTAAYHINNGPIDDHRPHTAIAVEISKTLSSPWEFGEQDQERIQPYAQCEHHGKIAIEKCGES
jgi:hypothetical protein